MEPMALLILSPMARQVNFYSLTISQSLFNSGSVWTISQRMRLSSAFFAVKIDAINNLLFLAKLNKSSVKFCTTYVQVIAEQPV
jgi:hypothetical protein